jgi:hypothetical protein
LYNCRVFGSEKTKIIHIHFDADDYYYICNERKSNFSEEFIYDRLEYISVSSDYLDILYFQNVIIEKLLIYFYNKGLIKCYLNLINIFVR